MPCTDGGDYIVREDETIIKRADYDLMMSRLHNATNTACEAMKALERRKGLGSVSQTSRDWWIKHQNEDAKRRVAAKERAKQIKRLLKNATEAQSHGRFAAAAEFLKKAADLQES